MIRIDAHILATAIHNHACDQVAFNLQAKSALSGYEHYETICTERLERLRRAWREARISQAEIDRHLQDVEIALAALTKPYFQQP